MRTAIYDTARYGPITVGDIMQVTINSPHDLQSFWPISKEDQLVWLARHGLIANSQTCPNAACGVNVPMSLIKDAARTDGFIVSTYLV